MTFRERTHPKIVAVLTSAWRVGVVAASALFIFFFVVYFNAGEKLRDTPAYDRGDVFFRSDTRRAWRDMVGERLSPHPHTSGHPNFVIFHQPVGWFLTIAIKDAGDKVKKIDAAKTASICMTSAAGAGVVALFYLLLVTLQLPRLRALLFTSVLGFSTVQLFYASVPETYMFSALGLMGVALIACRPRVGGAWWHLTAVYAWSALTTNIVLVGIWAMVRHWQPSCREWLRKVAVVMTVTVVLMVALNVVQRLIYPGTVLFFAAHSVAREAHWLYWERFQVPVETSRILLQHQWISNIIAPEAVKLHPFKPDEAMASIEAGTWDMFAPAWPLFGVWCLVLAGAAVSLFDRRFYTPVVLGGLGVMAFNFCFFFVFGHDRMLYAALWTSTAVLLVAAGWERLIQRMPVLSKPLAAVLVALISGQAWHNWQFLDKIAALVK